MRAKPAPELDPEVDPIQAGRGLALRRLGRYPQTAQQLLDYLGRKGLSESEAETVVSQLAAAGLVDDYEYAQMWARSRRRIRMAGNSAIRRELSQKGVQRDVIDAALAAEPADEVALASELATRKWQALARLEPEVRTRRVVGLLVRRGHSAGVAFSIVNKLAKSMPL